MPNLRTFKLSAGKHESARFGTCVMEAETVFWGLGFSDAHPCVCPAIGEFCRAWNDCLPTDADRQRLLHRFIGRLAGTSKDAETEMIRRWMCFDWLVRECAAEFLSLSPRLVSHSRALRALPEIRGADFGLAALAAARDAARDAVGDAARDAVGDAAWDAARDAARVAAWAAARDAAWVAAWDAARDAARDAAGDAAWVAAWAAAWVAAWAAARDAAWVAARDAARQILAPSVELLQTSAADLLDRMIRLTELVEATKCRDLARCG